MGNLSQKISTGLSQQLIPITGWMTGLQHFAKNTVRIIFAFAGAFGALVIHPGIYDHLALSVVAKENPILLEKLGTEPMFVISTKRVALSVLRPGWILGNNLKP